jgi:uncharacterized protein
VKEPLKSAIYEGWVSHMRYGAPVHSFRHRLTMCYVALDEVEEVVGLHPLWSSNRKNVVQFRRSDYIGDPEVPLINEVRAIAKQDGAQVRVLTHLRTWGWCFNPISLYYCFDDAGKDLNAVVASVTNTPWGESHDYVLTAGEDQRVDQLVPKQLHVSPFFGMDQVHRFAGEAPGSELQFVAETHEQGHSALRAELRLKRRELDRMSMTAMLLRYPFMTWRVSVGIYLQAARLGLKGAQFHAHPDSAGNRRARA